MNSTMRIGIGEAFGVRRIPALFMQRVSFKVKAPLCGVVQTLRAVSVSTASGGFALVFWVIFLLRIASGAEINDYGAIDSNFAQHCLDCHAAKDPDGEFVLESYDTLMKGGELG